MVAWGGANKPQVHFGCVVQCLLSFHLKHRHQAHSPPEASNQGSAQ